MENEQPIIVIKKKGGHAGHHGGAWKVAYADFVTAMMSLFIVLWLMGADSKTKKAVSAYFKDPTGVAKQTGSGQAGSGESLTISENDMGHLKEKMEDALKKMPEFQKLKNQIDMTVTGEGLRIELMETEKGVFFDTGSPQPSEYGQDLLKHLAQEIGKLQNHVLIEGHTDSRPFPGDSYTNWELSSDRANSARRLMQSSGVRLDQVSQVRGYADQKLRDPKNPEDAANRRISIIVQYQNPVAAPPPPAPAAASVKKAAAPAPKRS